MHGLYNWHQLPGTPVHAKVLEWAWLNSRQAQAIRNRYRMVVRELESALQEKLAEGHPVIKLYSLAGGSGQAVFEAASRFPHPERLQITLMDKDQTALKQSAKLAREDFKLTNELQLQEIDIIETPIESLKDHHGQAHIVEMVGLMDYLSANSCDQALSKALTLLNPEGHLVTAHIHPNEEKILLERILDWAPMIYKTKAQFKQLLEKQAAKLHSFHTEPHRIHSVSRLKKQA